MISSSRKDEIGSSSQEDEPPLYLDFPSPFYDEISTIPLLKNNDNYFQQHPRSSNKPLNIIEPVSSSESKCVKKRRVGKKDRHSKIHTAQGLRDRRMRLSLDIARKFFHLQDLLGFDKASNTIEWLFSKSNKAIKEVAHNFNPQDQTNQIITMSDQEIENMNSLLSYENKESINKPELLNSSKHEEIKKRKSRKQIQILNSKHEEIKNRESRKQIQRETRDQARARARERVMIKELEKSKRLFERNPNDEIHKLGLRYLVSPNNHNVEELGYINHSPSEPFIQQELQLASVNVNSFENYCGPYCSTLIDHNPPACWLSSSNGFLGEWDSGSYITENFNYGIVPNTAPLTGTNTYEQNPSSFFMSTTTNINLQFQSQNQGE